MIRRRKGWRALGAACERLENRTVLSNGPLYPLTAIPVRHSDPSAQVTLYLDFNGHFEANWGGYHNITTPVFDMDDDPTTFSQSELNAIDEIWQRVSEDYAPFPIDVTTVEPPSFDNKVAVRVAIGGNSTDWLGGNYGGYAYVGSFVSSVPNVSYVFSERFTYPDDIADAVSHEAGHAFGLDHQSEYTPEGIKSREYYRGDSTGAPLMGNSYSSLRTRWWLGTANSLTDIQDDLSILSGSANGFGYRPDDYGDTFAAGEAINLSSGALHVAGLIGQMSDVDVFVFQVPATNDFRVNYHAALLGANLDATVELLNANGDLIDTVTTDQIDAASLESELTPGTYQVRVLSNGIYGSLGRYTLDFTLGTDPPPLPAGPSDFGGHYYSLNRVDLSWVDGQDEIQYELFGRSPTGQVSSFILPLDTTEYTWNSTTSLEGWSFQLVARNAVGSVATDWTNPTYLPPTVPQNLTVSQWTLETLVVAWDDTVGESQYVVQVARQSLPDVVSTFVVAADTTSFIIPDLLPGETYLVRVAAGNVRGSAIQDEPVVISLPAAATLPDVSAPAEVSAHLNPSGNVTLAWGDVAGAIGYQVVQVVKKEIHVLEYVSADDLSTIVTPAVSAKKMKFRILASNGESTTESRTVKIKRKHIQG